MDSIQSQFKPVDSHYYSSENFIRFEEKIKVKYLTEFTSKVDNEIVHLTDRLNQLKAVKKINNSSNCSYVYMMKQLNSYSYIDRAGNEYQYIKVNNTDCLIDGHFNVYEILGCIDVSSVTHKQTCVTHAYIERVVHIACLNKEVY